jgi:hypothetical protein
MRHAQLVARASGVYGTTLGRAPPWPWRSRPPGASPHLATLAGGVQCRVGQRLHPRVVGIVSGIVLLGILFVAYYCGLTSHWQEGSFQRREVGHRHLVVGRAHRCRPHRGRRQQVQRARTAQQFPPDSGQRGKSEHRRHHRCQRVVIVNLLGAILGGLAGTHFHRKVDRTRLGS